MSQVYYVLTRIRGYRPAAVLLHTAETDAVLIDTAGDLGVACLQLPAPAVLRQSVRSVWDLALKAYCAKLTPNILQVWLRSIVLGSKVRTQTLGMYATQQQVLDRIRHEAKPLLTSARQVLAARLESLGIQDGHAKSDEFELDDETLCKLVAVLTTALPCSAPGVPLSSCYVQVASQRGCEVLWTVSWRQSGRTLAVSKMK
ncbi:hypothetical protein ABBQ32_012915 [Trebouxia sp. C0010 RCD-2024]